MIKINGVLNTPDKFYLMKRTLIGFPVWMVYTSHFFWPFNNSLLFDVSQGSVLKAVLWPVMVFLLQIFTWIESCLIIWGLHHIFLYLLVTLQKTRVIYNPQGSSTIWCSLTSVTDNFWNENSMLHIYYIAQYM